MKTGENEKFEQEFAWIIIKFWFHKTILDSPSPPESFLSSEMAKLKKMSRGVPVFCNFLVLNSIFFCNLRPMEVQISDKKPMKLANF